MCPRSSILKCLDETLCAPIQTLSGSYGAEDGLTVVVVVTADDDEDGIGDDSELDDAAERSDFSLSTLPANVFNNYNSHPAIHVLSATVLHQTASL